MFECFLARISSLFISHFSWVTTGTITKIANFYGVKLNKKEHQKIVGKCSFDYMKKHEEMFRLALPLNPDYDSTILKTGGMMRKGAIGDGEELFTEKGMIIVERLYYTRVYSQHILTLSLIRLHV